MQFIKNGPDVPERLLQAHEDGRVVSFFAGRVFPIRQNYLTSVAPSIKSMLVLARFLRGLSSINNTICSGWGCTGDSGGFGIGRQFVADRLSNRKIAASLKPRLNLFHRYE